MEDKSTQEHFLDTSVARSLLLATQAYKQYFDNQLREQSLYISNYVQMEIKRSYLQPSYILLLRTAPGNYQRYWRRYRLVEQ